MSELTCLELSVALWVVHVVIQASVGNSELPYRYLFTSRDTPAAARGLFYGRATRALANYVENLTPFVALALALIVTQRTGGAARLARRSGFWRASSTFRFICSASSTSAPRYGRFRSSVS